MSYLILTCGKLSNTKGEWKMGKWIYVICFLLLTLNSIAVAENSMVTKKEQKEWLRHLIPLPHEISFKEKITIFVAENIAFDDLFSNVLFLFFWN